MRSLTTAVLLLSTLLLSACGFQLRGTHNALDSHFSSIRIVDKSGDKAFQQAVSNALQNTGVDISEDALTVLTLVKSKQEKRTASFSSRAKSAEYELLKTVTFQLQRDQDVLLENTELQSRRSYLYRETAAVGRAEEENLLRREMNQDLAQRILLALQRAVQ